MKNASFLLLMLALSFFMAACGTHFDPAGITDGMSEGEITAKFGEPDMWMSSGDEKTLVYGEHTIVLLDGKVKLDANVDDALNLINEQDGK